MHSREVALLWASCITVTVWVQRDINLVALGHCMYANGLVSVGFGCLSERNEAVDFKPVLCTAAVW